MKESALSHLPRAGLVLATENDCQTTLTYQISLPICHITIMCQLCMVSGILKESQVYYMRSL